MKICGMEHVTDDPCHSVPDGSKEERQDFLTNLCRKVVQEVWLLTPYSDLQAVLEAEVDGKDLGWCFCGEGRCIMVILFNVTLNMSIQKSNLHKL